MRILKLFLVLVISSSALFAISPLDEKRIVLDKISKDTYKLRVYFNYENPYQTEHLFTGTVGEFALTVPSADRYEILKASAHIQYVPSIVLDPDRSILSFNFNGKVIRQYRINKRKFLDIGSGNVQAHIPTKLFDEYNRLAIKVTQHYSAQEKAGDPELWTQLDLQNSYIEFIFKHKEMPEKISSISKFFFDNKAIVKDKINFVFPKFPTEEDFTNYGFMAGAIGNILGFRDIDFTVSTKLSNYKNNVIVMLKRDVQALFEPYASNFEGGMEALNTKLSGNINVIQNPLKKDKGFLVITGETPEELQKGLYRLIDSDLNLYDEQNLQVLDISIPAESQPFTAPRFLKAGEKVHFSDLGFDTSTFGGGNTNFNLNFRVYPNNSFSDEKISAKFNYVYPKASGSIANVFLNNKFVHQMPLDNDKQLQLLPAELLQKGNNNLNVKFYLDEPTLKLTMMKDSYLVLPKGSNYVKMPDLKYISDVAFPFSIYPDLRKTGILITDFDSRSITSAMYMAFFLGKTVGYPPYRLKVTANINTIRDRDIILVGAFNKKYQILYNEAPLNITDQGAIRQYALDTDFEHKVIAGSDNSERFEKHSQVMKIFESGTNANYLIAQMFKSPFDADRTILSITAQDGQTLIKGVRNGLVPKHLGAFGGDLWLYHTVKDRSYSFQVREQYLLKDVEVEKTEFEQEEL
jgi:hypothetical protein